MVRKIVCFVCLLGLITATTCGTVQATSHNVYENGNLSTTYITYFKDILSGSSFNSDYVAFRSGQYSYTLIVGDLKYENGVITSAEKVKEYVYSTNSSNYNSLYYYDVNELDTFSVNTSNYILYSNVGDFPELIERGAKHEMLQTLLICICLLCIVISRIFYKR